MTQKHLRYYSLLMISLLTATIHLAAQPIRVDKNNGLLQLTTKDHHLEIVVNFRGGYYIKSCKVAGNNVLSENGTFTGLSTTTKYYSSRFSKHVQLPQTTDSSVRIPGIVLTASDGSQSIQTTEDWTFVIRKDRILWKIDRHYKEPLTLDHMAFPEWTFRDMSVWKAGIINNGGIIWCKYLSQEKDTYGVHASGTMFWNGQTGQGLSIQAVNWSQGNDTPHMAIAYSRTPKGEFSMSCLLSSEVPQQRYHLNRFVHGHTDVFAPVKVQAGVTSVTYELKTNNYFDQYSRGNLQGIDPDAVRDLLNTTARYGVVDDSIVGGNGWLTNWKCLHEPFFARLAMAIDDSAYTKNLENTLDREMKLAIQPDGRVLSRWHNEPGDEIPGTYNPQTGYYEAKWGYTIDAQPGYVLNVAELFDLTGNLTWLRTHQTSCEKALEWLIRRDENNNGIFEMKNKNTQDGTCSDWLDIVWASYENAFVNAQMYGALIKWAACEKILGNENASARYTRIARRLKTAFNQPVNKGGFWLPEKNQFIYWRDQDGSTHGDNLVTPVQFATIGYGLCDDPGRIDRVLDQIQQRMEKENLFHWPLCFDSYKRAEVSGGNWPFPTYENGDIFLTWGYLGISSYAGYKKELAVAYIQKLLEQYKKDGLSFQRYGRQAQKGLGDDILAGNASSIAALYGAIYGIQPRWNRLVLDPHLPKELQGTSFPYTLRGEKYQISFPTDQYQIQTDQTLIRANQAFGISNTPAALRIYPGDQDTCLVRFTRQAADSISLTIHAWNHNRIEISGHLHNPGQATFQGLPVGLPYRVAINNHKKQIIHPVNGTFKLKKLPRGKFSLRIEPVLP